MLNSMKCLDIKDIIFILIHKAHQFFNPAQMSFQHAGEFIKKLLPFFILILFSPNDLLPSLKALECIEVGKVHQI